MSAWPGKFGIGLTGNIAVGKSVVRKMLEHLGAYGIDADSLAHRAIAKNAPGYQAVIETFGRYILASDGQIDRRRLGKVVFSDDEALRQLEGIIHPLVVQAVAILVRRSTKKVIVIEAIKLLESGLAKMCDSIWVTYAPQEQQVARLVSKRGLTEPIANQRIHSQPPQEQKTACADVVIRNEGSYEDTWRQVVSAWGKLVPAEMSSQLRVQEKNSPFNGFIIERAQPRQTDEITAFISQLHGVKLNMSSIDIMAAFGEKAFLLLRMSGRICGMAGWKVENLIACTDDILVDDKVNFTDAMQVLISEVERASCELQCEISLLFLPADLSGNEETFYELGYQRRTADSLDVPAWREAAAESTKNGSIMLFKQLRKDRVLRPV